MDQLKETLKTWAESLPQPVQDFLESGGWWAVLAVALLLFLWVGYAVVSRVFRAVFRKRSTGVTDWDRDTREDLNDCPLPVQPVGDRQLTVYHVPVRLRLIVIAPPGNDLIIDATAIERLLDLIVPGLGAMAVRDRPRIRVWGGQLSHEGFAATFHRCTPRPEGDDVPSRWVLVAGRAQVGRQPVLLGLGLWTDMANMIGRVTLEPHQWLDVLRVRAADV
jgi:hypothetical protein